MIALSSMSRTVRQRPFSPRLSPPCPSPGVRSLRPRVLRPLPAAAEAGQGQADPLLGRFGAVSLAQMPDERRRHPDRGAIAPRAGVVVADRLDQRTDQPPGRGGSVAARAP